jgi:hypothetical protein
LSRNASEKERVIHHKENEIFALLRGKDMHQNKKRDSSRNKK